MKKVISLTLTFLLFFNFAAISFGAEIDDYNSLEYIYDTINDIIVWKNSGNRSGSVIDDELCTGAGTSAMDWFAFSAGRYGIDEDYSGYIAAAEDYANSDSTGIITDYQRLSLAVLSCGGDPSQNGLLDKSVFSVLNDETLDEKLVNSLIFALLILDSEDYMIPDDTGLTRSALISQILSNSLASGAFVLSGNTPDTDITCMAVQALAPYYNSGEIFTYIQNDVEKTSTVREVVDNALAYLSSVQLADGTMPTWGSATCETTAQAIIALCTMGIDPSTDSRFIKNGNSLIDGLLSYKMSDGGFAHTVSEVENTSNSLATVQTFYALVSYCRFENGYRALYDFRKEPDIALNTQITELVENIEKLETSDTAAASVLLSDYEKIPTPEKRYVYNFYILSDVLSALGIQNNADYTSDELGTSKIGSGFITDVTVGKHSEAYGETLGAVDENFSKLEVSSYDGNKTQSIGNMSVTQTAVIISIGIAAAVVIVLNHTVFKKRRSKSD